MRRTQKTVVVAALMLLGCGFALAMEPTASVEKGKALFNDTHLGPSGKSCNSCHPNGKGLDMAGEEENLEDTINGCINRALKGKPLDDDSVEMQSLVLYIRSLAK